MYVYNIYTVNCTVYNAQAVNSVLLEKKDLDGFDQNIGNSEKVSTSERIAGVGQGLKNNLPSRFTMWRPPLGGDIRHGMSIRSTLL